MTIRYLDPKGSCISRRSFRNLEAARACSFRVHLLGFGVSYFIMLFA